MPTLLDTQNSLQTHTKTKRGIKKMENTEWVMAILTPFTIFQTIKEISEQNYWEAIFIGLMAVIGIIAIIKYIKNRGVI